MTMTNFRLIRSSKLINNLLYAVLGRENKTKPNLKKKSNLNDNDKIKTIFLEMLTDNEIRFILI